MNELQKGSITSTVSRIPQSEKLAALGILPELVLLEYLEVVNQRKDFSNKLKALKPLLHELGIDLDLSTQPASTNNIHVHVSERNMTTGDIYDIEEPSK